jgi:NAD(P)-dependent dehydrogenase (short-subunit alcohol dehydrogenase family)
MEIAWCRVEAVKCERRIEAKIKKEITEMADTSKVAIITGGAKGIGEGCTRAFCGAGWRVVISDYDEKSGVELAREMNAQGLGEVHFELADMRKEEDIRRVIDNTLERYGRLDALVNNAGWHPPTLPIDDFSVQDFLDLLQLNLIAVFVGCKLALPHLRKTRGSIVNISSLVAQLGQEGATIYCATKGAVSAFTKALAIDEAKHGVRVNAILPGNIYTHMRITSVAASPDPQGLHNWLERTQHLGRSGTIQEAGQTCLFLASDQSSFITGIDLILSGGAELGYGPKIP